MSRLPLPLLLLPLLLLAPALPPLSQAESTEGILPVRDARDDMRRQISAEVEAVSEEVKAEVNRATTKVEERVAEVTGTITTITTAIGAAIVAILAVVGLVLKEVFGLRAKVKEALATGTFQNFSPPPTVVRKAVE